MAEVLSMSKSSKEIVVAGGAAVGGMYLDLTYLEGKSGWELVAGGLSAAIAYFADNKPVIRAASAGFAIPNLILGAYDAFTSGLTF